MLGLLVYSLTGGESSLRGVIHNSAVIVSS